jgi:hypothetical protein
MEYDLALVRRNIKTILMRYPNQKFKVKEFRSLYKEIHDVSLTPPPGSSLRPTAFFASLKLKDVVVDIDEKCVVFTPNLCVQDLVLSSEKIINKMYRDSLSPEENSVLVKIEELRDSFDSVFGKMLEGTLGNSAKIEWVKREMGRALETIKTKYDLEEET